MQNGFMSIPGTKTESVTVFEVSDDFRGGVRFAAHSEKGTRDEQQDSYAVIADGERFLCAVCDGMGGHEGGSRASAFCADMLRKMHFDGGKALAPMDFLKSFVYPIDKSIALMCDRNGQTLGAGTTIAALIVENGAAHWLSCGDSRLYIIRASEMVQVTKDHIYKDLLDAARERGQITEKRYLSELPKGGALTSYLGIGGVKTVDLSRAPFSLCRGDRLLCITDGVYRVLSDREIFEAVSHGDVGEAVTRLFSRLYETARGRECDNSTVILAEYTG